MDKWHGRNHAKSCKASPWNDKKLMERNTDLNTSCSGQVLSWFRKYGITFNEMKYNRHYFLVLLYCRMHNEALNADEANYLNKYSYNNNGPSNKKRYRCHDE